MSLERHRKQKFRRFRQPLKTYLIMILYLLFFLTTSEQATNSIPKNSEDNCYSSQCSKHCLQKHAASTWIQIRINGICQ